MMGSIGRIRDSSRMGSFMNTSFLGSVECGGYSSTMRIMTRRRRRSLCHLKIASAFSVNHRFRPPPPQGQFTIHSFSGSALAPQSSEGTTAITLPNGSNSKDSEEEHQQPAPSELPPTQHPSPHLTQANFMDAPLSESLTFTSLSGAGVIGMNCSLYSYGGKHIMVDYGVGFSHRDLKKSEDDGAFYPELLELCKAQSRCNDNNSSSSSIMDNLEAIFVTHAHEDHIGAIVPLWATRLKECNKIYGTRLVIEMLKAKAKRAWSSSPPRQRWRTHRKQQTRRKGRHNHHHKSETKQNRRMLAAFKKALIQVNVGDRIAVGGNGDNSTISNDDDDSNNNNITTSSSSTTSSNFNVQYVAVNHSIPESCSLVIRTPVGMVVHTGDYRIDKKPLMEPPMDLEAFSRIGNEKDTDGNEGVLAVVGDSTNATNDSPSPATEAELADSIQDLIQDLSNGNDYSKNNSNDSGGVERIFISCFSTDFARIRSILRAAKANNRKVGFHGRAMVQNVGLAKRLGYLRGYDASVKKGGVILNDVDSLLRLPPQEQIHVMTGCQGEPSSALDRLSRGKMRIQSFEDINSSDAIVFSSRPIPGNEAVVHKMQQRLKALYGVTVISDGQKQYLDYVLHISGHPNQPDLREMYLRLNPKILLAVHGEYIHQRCNLRIGQECGILHNVLPRDGQVIRLGGGGLSNTPKVLGTLPVTVGQLPCHSLATCKHVSPYRKYAAVVTVLFSTDGLQTQPCVEFFRNSDTHASGFEWEAEEWVEEEVCSVCEAFNNQWSPELETKLEEVVAEMYSRHRSIDNVRVYVHTNAGKPGHEEYADPLGIAVEV